MDGNHVMATAVINSSSPTTSGWLKGKRAEQKETHFIREQNLKQKVLEGTACPQSTSLTNEGKDSFDDALHKLQALESCPGTKVTNVLVFSTGVLQGVLH